MNLNDLKIRDVNTFLSLAETGSVRESARHLGLSPSQVSKSIQSLEDKLHRPLLDRFQNGVRPTPQAEEVIRHFRSIQDHCELLMGLKSDKKNEEHFQLATTSFFSTQLLPEVLTQLTTEKKQRIFRLIELPPGQFISVGLRGGFQFCIHMTPMDWPKTWETIPVGKLRWVLCCRSGHPLTKKCSLPKLLKYPFVYPAYWSSEGVKFGDDNCPLKISKRVKGHETSTAASAAKFVQYSDHVAFLPEITVRDSVKYGEIKILKATSWPVVDETVYLTVKSESVRKKIRDEMAQVIKSKLRP